MLKNFFVIILNLIVVILYNFDLIVDSYLQVLYYELIIVIKMMVKFCLKIHELNQLIHLNSLFYFKRKIKKDYEKINYYKITYLIIITLR